MFAQQTMDLVCSADDRRQVLKTAIGRKVLGESIGELDWMEELGWMEDMADEYGSGVFD